MYFQSVERKIFPAILNFLLFCEYLVLRLQNIFMFGETHNVLCVKNIFHLWLNVYKFRKKYKSHMSLAYTLDKLFSS